MNLNAKELKFGLFLMQIHHMTSEDLGFCAAWGIFRISSFLFQRQVKRFGRENRPKFIFPWTICLFYPQFEPEGKWKSYFSSVSSLISVTAVVKPFARGPAGRDRAPQGAQISTGLVSTRDTFSPRTVDMRSRRCPTAFRRHWQICSWRWCVLVVIGQ